MSSSKSYVKPILLVQDIESHVLSSSSNDEEPNHRTTTLDRKWGIPEAGEKVLVIHEDCRILKYDKFLGLQTASFQYLTCCVTDKRILLLPQDTLPNQNKVSLLGSLLGVNPIGKYILMREIYDKRINSPYAIWRQNINKIEVGMKENPVMQGISIFINGERLLLGCKDYDYAFDIQAAFYNPDWDWSN